MNVPATADEVREIARSRQDLLDVVDDEQCGRVTKVVREISVGFDGVRDGRRHEHGVAHRREVNEPHAVREPIREIGRHRKCKARLPNTARPRDGDEPRAVVEQPPHVQNLIRPSYERVRRTREIRPEEASERWKALIADLKDALRSGEVLEAVLAEIGEVTAALDQRGGRGREDNLAAMSGGGDPRGAMHVVSDVPFVSDDRGTGVDSRSNANRPRRECSGERFRCGQRRRRTREGEEEGVTLGVHLDAPRGRARFADYATVLGKRVGIRLGAERLKQHRRALDVREEERDGAVRKVVSHAAIFRPLPPCVQSLGCG
jgi:hypothetical protein